MIFFDRDEFIRAWSIVHPEGDPVEIRIFGQRGRSNILSGYFTDPVKAADAIEKIPLSGCTVCWTINQLHPGCLARMQRGQIVQAGITTADTDVIRRLWLPIDLDPDRPSGCSASDEELKGAEEMAEKIASTLTGNGYPDPLKVHSGNGVHLLFPMDAPNTKEAAAACKSFLEDMGRKFDNESVHIDAGIFNAARVMKAPGTCATKGAHAPDLGRSWRMARLFDSCRDYVRPEEVIEL